MPRGSTAEAQKTADALSAILSAPPDPLKGYNPNDPRSFDYLKDAPASQREGTPVGGLSAGTLAACVLGGAALAGVLVAAYYAFADDGRKKRRK